MAEIESRRPSLFSFVEREAIVKVLDEFINELAIYQHILKNILKHSSGITQNGIFLELGCGSNMQLLNESTRMTVEELQNKATHEKLYNDSLYIESVMEKVKAQVREEGRFDALTEEIEMITTREKEEKALLEECEEMERTVVELRKTIAEERIANEREKTRLMDELVETRKERKRSKFISNMERKYLDAWERAQREQHLLCHQIEMEELQNTLKSCCVIKKNEERVQKELMTFLIQQIATMEKQAEEWRMRYEREKESYDRQIHEVRDEIESRRKIVEQLREEYNEKQKFIDAYLAEKEALRKRKEHEEHRRRSAIKIQAWWRGVMVRRKLGPYRPEEKKKKRSGKAKK